MGRLRSAWSFALLLLTSGGAGAAPGDLAGDFMPFGTDGKINNLGLDVVTKATVDDLGRLIVVGQNGSQLAVQRRSGARYAVREDLVVTIDPATVSAAVDVAIAPDGKIVVAGNVGQGDARDFVVVRVNPDLTLDATFEGDGIQVVPFDGTREDRASAVAVQADRKIVVVGTGRNANGFVDAVIRLNENGTLDDTFDGNGKKAFDDGLGGFADVAVQSDGKIVVIGDVRGLLSDRQLTVGRLNSNGAPDTAFNGGDFHEIDFGDIDSEGAVAVAIAPDGKIVVAADNIRIARFLPANGALDGTFDGDGLLIEPISTTVTDLVVQRDGKIVIVGYNELADPKGFLLTRYNVGGDRDVTFGDRGQVVTLFLASATPSSLTVQGDGMLVAVGGPQGTRAAARYRTDGSPDTGGTATLPFAREHAGSEATALTVDAEGSLVAAGKVFRDDYDMALARITPNGGGLDPMFGAEESAKSGKVVYGLGLQSEEIRAVTTQADGDIVVAGEVNTQVNGQNFLVGRFNEGGDHDLGCSFIGFTSIHYDTGDDRARGVQVAADGRIYAAGTVRGPTNDDFGAVRLTTACRVDIAGGNVTAPVEYKPRRDLGGQETGVGLLLQGGRVVLAGSSGSDIVLVRLLSPNFITGSILTDTGFGDGGRAMLDLGHVESASGLAAQPDGSLIVAGTVTQGGSSDFVVTRFSADGDRDAGFGIAGVAVVDFSAVDVATSLAVRGDGSIAVAGYTVRPTGTEFAVAQLTPDGDPDFSFSGDGKTTVRIGSEGGDVAHAVTFLGGDRLVLGGYATILGLRQFALAGFETTRDVTVPTTTTTSLAPGETTTTTTEPGATTSTTTTVSGGTTTTAQFPGAQEVCGNCRDDDGDGLVDFEDPSCCPAGTSAMTLRKLGIAGGKKGTKLALSGTLAESGVAPGTTVTQDVFLQVATGEQALLCAHVPAGNLKRKKARLRFKDAAHGVVSAAGLERLRLRVKKDGSGALAAGSKAMPFAVPTAGTAVVTLGLRDPAAAESGNRCARAQAALEASKKGALRLP